jgi:hypothetical protein
MGLLFKNAPVKPELPDELAYILENIDGTGQDIDQQSQSVSRDVTLLGRDGLLADTPRNEEGREITQADVNNGFRATVQEYKAESIVFWHHAIINGIKKLDVLILHEVVEQLCGDHLIEVEEVSQYRIYRLTDSGVTVQLYTEGKDGLEFADAVDVIDGFGSPVREIMFEFVGSINNDSSIDNAPMEPIANVNLGHYQESANMASSSFNLSAAQPVISDDDYQKYTGDNDGETTQDFGEQACLVLGSSGKFDIIAPPENSLATTLSKKYEDQMVALGAQLITDSSGNETAEAARIKHGSDVSQLDTIANNVSDAYSKMLQYVAMLMGVVPDPTWRYELNREFFDSALDAQQAMAVMSMWQGKVISTDVIQKYLVGKKVIGQDVDLEMMNDAIAEESTSVGMPSLDQVDE